MDGMGIYACIHNGIICWCKEETVVTDASYQRLERSLI